MNDTIETIAREMALLGSKPDAFVPDARNVAAMMVTIMIADVLALAALADDDYAPDGYCNDCGAKVLGGHGCEMPYVTEDEDA